MTKSHLLSRWPRLLQYVIFLGVVAVVITGLAQTPDERRGRVLIDGRLNPEKVPDWILWNEIFTIAAHLNEKSPTKGGDLWTDRLHLPKEVMDEIIEHGYEQLEMADDARIEAEAYVTDSKQEKPDKIDHPNRQEGLRIKLKAVQLNKESRTLEIRDKLCSKESKISEGIYEISYSKNSLFRFISHSDYFDCLQ